MKAAAETEVPGWWAPAAPPPVTVVTTLPLVQVAWTLMPATPIAGIAKFETVPADATAVNRPSSSATAPVAQPCEPLIVDQAAPELVAAASLPEPATTMPVAATTPATTDALKSAVLRFMLSPFQRR